MCLTAPFNTVDALEVAEVSGTFTVDRALLSHLLDPFNVPWVLVISGRHFRFPPYIMCHLLTLKLWLFVVFLTTLFGKCFSSLLHLSSTFHYHHVVSFIFCINPFPY
ncbi:hypothetical protein GDO81_014175 [Engystomops pustulosus]|uniref:Uncharacterized protein n=1 Tax=Engystomops pustulosus TaxID=76066 RepID=A0AAV7B8I5_ENGPU|nr:hypothetical protein GDO81_014175 [Engystomops pustulosus]